MGQAGVLHVIGGSDRGKQFPITLPETRVGRGTDQDVVLSDIAVSRRHFTILLEGGRCRVRDLGSGNGTLVNGVKVSEQPLNPGDHIEIGQTVMRFDQVAGTGVPKAGPSAPTMSDPRLAPAPAAPKASPKVGPLGPVPVFPVETPSDAVRLPTAMPAAMPAAMQVHPPSRSVRSRLAAVGQKQLLVFGAMALLSMISILIILARTVFARPSVTPSDAETLYRRGLSQFAGGDFEGARVVFAEAAKLVPDSPEAAHYAELASAEVRAKELFKNAERAATDHRWAEALKGLDSIDPQTTLFGEAQRRRKEYAASIPQEAPAPAAKVESLDRPDRRRRHNAADEPAPVVHPPKTPKESPAPAGGSLVPAALAAYRGKDFAAADRLERQEALKQTNPKESAKTLETANQVRALKGLLDKAGVDEAKSPEQAIKDYEEAIVLDAKLARGAHAGFIKSKIGKCEVASAQNAFNQGKYDVAFATLLQGQRHGGSDGGGLMKQLDAKASELVAKGQGLQKSNLGQAKTYWRMVVHMVPANSPVYVKAYGLLNAGDRPHKDEDEN